jgi:CheY-like chemotaxis protein
MPHILIADDDEFLAKLYSNAFERAGYKTTMAFDGKAAVGLLLEDKPDLILLDLSLPIIDGIGVLKFIRSNIELENLPVYIISSSSYFSGIVQTAWSEGATYFVEKGQINPTALIEEIRNIIPPGNVSESESPKELQIDYQTRITTPKNNTSVITKKILIADDDRIIHGVLSFFLGQDGFNVESAFDGIQALEMAHQEKPNVLVLDVSMPGKDGFETLEEWKNDSELKDIPVIMLTASNDDAMQRKALELGAARYLIKPFSPDSLVQLANELIH